MVAPWLLKRLQQPLSLLLARALPAPTEMALHAQAVPLVLPRLVVVTAPRQPPQLLACAWPTFTEMAQAARALFVLMVAPSLPRLQHQLPLLLVIAHALPTGTEMVLRAPNATLMWCVLLL